MAKAVPITDILPTIEQCVASIIDVYNRSSETDKSEGIEWYPLAHAFAYTVGRRSHKRGAGIIAALSPQTSWPENKRLALAASGSARITGQTGRNCEKATDCRSGYDPLDVLGGRKVRAFYALILDPTNAYDVVIDRHAFDIALGYETDNLARKVLERKGGYDFIADAYRKAASELGILPSVLQATTWLAWRRIKRPNPSSFTASGFEAQPVVRQRIKRAPLTAADNVDDDGTELDF